MFFYSLSLLATAALAGCSATAPATTDARAADDTAHDVDESTVLADDATADDDASALDATADGLAPDATVTDPLPPTSEPLDSTMLPISKVPCQTALGEFPANIARHPDGGVVGTCSTFSGTSSRWWHVLPPSYAARMIADDLAVALDETLVLPDGNLVATIPNASVLHYAALPDPHVLNEVPWPNATYVKGLAYDANSHQLAVGASMLDFVSGDHQPGRLHTYTVDGDTIEPFCQLDHTGGKNFTSLGFAQLGTQALWVGINSEPFGESLQQSLAGSLVFINQSDCTVLRSVPIPGSLGITGQLSIAPTAQGFQVAIPSARNEPEIYLATITATGAADINADTTDVTLAAIPYPEAEATIHFTTSAVFSPLSASLFTCDLNQQRCWQFAKAADGSWPVAQTYALEGTPTNAVWGPEGVWLVAGAELILIPGGQTP